MRFASGRQRLAAGWVDRSLRAKGLVVIAVPVAILVLVLATTFWFTHIDNRAQNIAGHARQLVDSATTLEDSLLSAQAGVGSYLLTGDANFATAYSRAEAVIPGQLDQLAGSADTADDAMSSAAIERDSNRLMFDMAQLALQRPSRAPSSVVRALLRFSQSETERLRADVATFSAKESAVIASQRTAIRTSSDLLPAIAIGAVVLALAGGVLVSQLFTTGVVTRLRRLERATEAIERGEVPEGAPTGGDEIGRLSARLLDTATQLQERAVERDRARTELENILTASPVVSLRYDVDGRGFSYASPNIERLLGISAEQATADPAAVMRRFHPDSRHTLRDMLLGGAGRHGDRFELLLRFRRDP
ncbi:MAG TPA: CHASE3 domain-containing protein, partial [Acidimicrobiales bacterium]|nr:CHASE3 domain-containing protein [Acidimicrobiales bacterium]